MTRRLISAAMVAAAISMSGLTPVLADDAPAPNRVVVIPLITLNVPSDQQWIGKATQETLIADLGKTKQFSPMAFQGQTIVEDNATAARIAREASAAYAIRGSAQLVNNEIRLTAQLIDAKSGDTVATGIATGAAGTILKLQDDLAAQLRTGPAEVAAPNQPLLPATVTIPPPAPAAPAEPAGPTYYEPEPVYPPPPFNDISLSAQNYNYPYDYGAYSSALFPVYYPGYYSNYCYPSFSGISFGFPICSHGFHDFHDFHDFHGSHGSHGGDHITHFGNNIPSHGFGNHAAFSPGIQAFGQPSRGMGISTGNFGGMGSSGSGRSGFGGIPTIGLGSMRSGFGGISTGNFGGMGSSGGMHGGGRGR